MVGKDKCKCFSTMGVPEVELNNPQNFLKKEDGLKMLDSITRLRKTEVEKVAHCLSEGKKPPVPGFKHMSTTRREHNKINWIASNKIELQKAATKKPSGRPNKIILEPCFVFKKNYGQVPSYIQHKPKIEPKPLKFDKRKIDSEVTKSDKNEITLSEDEYDKLLLELESKRKELNNQYDKLPLLIDTQTRVRRKTWLESELDQVEKCIDFFKTGSD